MDEEVNYCSPVEMSHKGFCLATFEKLVKYFSGGSYLVMNVTARVPSNRALLAIGYKYNYRKVLRFISTECDGSNEPGDSYLSCFPDIYSNVSVCSVVRPHLLGRYLNPCNTIDSHNRMRKSDLELE